MNLEVITDGPRDGAHPVHVIFVHGMSHAAWCWAEHFMPCCARHGYVSHALSLRGHGGSEGRQRLRWTSLADYVSDLAQVAGRLEPPPVLVGHSMGGLIVQKYLESHAATAAVLMASVPPGSALPAALRVARRHPLVLLRAILALSLLPLVGVPELAREYLFSDDMHGERVAGYAARLQEESFRALLDMLGMNLPRPGRVAVPMLVLGAADDRLITPAEVAATARAWRTREQLFPGMARDMMLESGWQLVADRLLGWLAEQGADRRPGMAC